MPGTFRLAVVVTSYNYEKYVGEAIQSVLSQSRKDVELVVIDDGSTDSSWAVVSGFTEVRSERIKNCGPVGACVRGLDMTTAPFVLFLDSDDRLEPGSLEFILERLEPDVAKLQFSLSRIDGESRSVVPAFRKLADFRGRASLVDEVLATGSYLTPPTSGNVLRRDVANLLREIDYADASADGVTAFAAPFFGDVVSVSNELGSYRVHGRNATSFGIVTPEVFDWETRRFVDAMNHLHRVLDRLGQGQGFPAATSFYTYKDRVFCRDVAAGRKPGVKKLVSVLVLLPRQRMLWKHKLALALFFVLTSLASPERAKNMLAYRHRTLGRTALGFLQIAVQRAPKSPADRSADAR